MAVTGVPETPGILSTQSANEGHKVLIDYK